MQSLERRSLLAVTFEAGPLAIPSNRPDQILGPILPSGFPEVPIKINPRDPANVVAFGGLMAYSTDAFATFTAPVVPPLPPGFTTNGGDGDLEFDAEGRLFTSHLVSAGPGTGTNRVAVGQWDPTTGTLLGSLSVIPSTPGQRNDDKPFIVTDTNPASPHLNSIYAVWDRFGVTESQWEVFFARSTDQGQTWTNVQQLSRFIGQNGIPGDADDERLCWPSDVAVAPNGDVYVTYHSQRDMNAQTLELNGQRVNPDGVSGRTLVRRSSDGGVTFSPAVEAFPAGTSDVTFNTQDALNGGNIPGTQFLTVGSATAYVLADPARPGNVYVITSDDPDNVHGTGDDADVVIARSTDHGQTWTRSTVVSGPANSFQLFPFTAIDRSGNLVLAWVDNRRGQTNASGRYLLDFMATYSTDGGVTWAPEFRLSDIGFDPDPNPVVRFAGPPPTTRIGEYFGIDLNGGTAHLIIDANFFSGPNPAGQAVTHTSFALAGSLTVTGGPGDDIISINPLTGSPGNPEFIEVLVNGQREYAGLFDGLSGITIGAGGGTDTINIAQTGAALPITILPSAGDDVVNVNAAGAGAANVVLADTMRLGALSMGAGGVVRLAPAGNRALTVGALTLNGSGTLDVSDNSLIVDYAGPTPLAQVRAALASGYAGGAWTGPGVRSASAAATPNRALGYAEASDLFTNFPATFAGQQVDNTSVLVTYTRYGDADMTRTVNLDDFNRLAANFGQSPRRWSQGDFTFDELVNLDDFNRLAANFGQSAAAAVTRSASKRSEEWDDQETLEELA